MKVLSVLSIYLVFAAGNAQLMVTGKKGGESLTESQILGKRSNEDFKFFYIKQICLLDTILGSTYDRRIRSLLLKYLNHWQGRKEAITECSATLSYLEVRPSGISKINNGQTKLPWACSVGLLINLCSQYSIDQHQQAHWRVDHRNVLQTDLDRPKTQVWPGRLSWFCFYFNVKTFLLWRELWKRLLVDRK